MSQNSTQARHTKFPFSLLRVLLCIYFLLYAYVVAIGMIPLPDQPPRIDFFGVFCSSLGVVIAYHMLTSSYRLFLVGVWAFLPLAISQMNDKLRFLEMMLEPKLLQTTVAYSLYGIFLLLISPVAFRLFNKSVKEYNPPRHLLLQKGVRY